MEKSGNVFRQFTNPAQIIERKDFGDLSDFDFDPYKKSHQAGFHSINFEDSQE